MPKKKSYKLRLQKNPCDQCLLTKNKIVSDQRRDQILKDCVKNDTHFNCHKAQMNGEDPINDPLVCRGFYNAYPGVGQLLRVMGRIGGIEEVEVTSEKEE